MSVTAGFVPLPVRRALYELKTVVARYPPLAVPIARLRHGDPVGPDTEIVIEGFPRTGNTFAVNAFNFAQPRPVRVACHVHAPAQLIAGARRRIPAIALVREPEETILSFVIRHSHVPVGQALRGYLRFYESLVRYRDRLVIGSFDEVITDFGAVIRRVNERFGTHFAEFVHTAENVRACLEQIERDYGAREERGEALERIVARPSPVRARMKEEIRPEYRAPRLSGLRARAERAFQVLVATDGATLP